MEASQFAMWLQGFAELSTEPPTKEQWQSIREHLQLVFTKVTPPLATPPIWKPAPNHKIQGDAQDAAKKMYECAKGLRTSQGGYPYIYC